MLPLLPVSDLQILIFTAALSSQELSMFFPQGDRNCYHIKHKLGMMSPEAFYIRFVNRNVRVVRLG